MIIWDTNVLALYFGKRLSPDDQLRVDGLVQEMRNRREPIGMPAPVFAEFLTGLSSTEKHHAFAVFGTAAFKFLPYDKKAAVETSMLAGKKISSARPRQAVKVDRQIIAIAKSSGARMILTNDTEMIQESIRFEVAAMSISDLIIPDKLKQHRIEFSGEADERGDR